MWELCPSIVGKVIRGGVHVGGTVWGELCWRSCGGAMFHSCMYGGGGGGTVCGSWLGGAVCRAVWGAVSCVSDPFTEVFNMLLCGMFQ